MTAIPYSVSALWHDPLPIERFSAGSHKKASWKCKQGHEWTEKIDNVVKRGGCPYCLGVRALPADLARPDLLKFWNDSSSMEEYSSRSHHVASWKCEHGHEWICSVGNQCQLKGEPCPYCGRRLVKQGFNDLKTRFPNLAEEWDASRNETDADSVCDRSGKMYWWKCDRGHSWQASISYRIRKNQECPLCREARERDSGNAVNLFPKLFERWDESLNGLAPSYLSQNDNTVYWWKCENHSHSYPSTILSQSKRIHCPYCDGKKLLKGFNDVKTVYPNLILWWSNKNEKKIDEVVSGSSYIARWECPQGHSFSREVAAVNRRRGKIQCPYCSNKRILKGFNDLGTLFPTIASEWSDLNKESADSVLSGSNLVVFWKCPSCHYVWKAKIADRTNRGNGCPRCSGQIAIQGVNDLATTHPDIALEWDDSKNTKTSSNVSAGSHVRAWWKCEKGHSWQTMVCERTRERGGSGCPVCATSGGASKREHDLYVAVSKMLPDEEIETGCRRVLDDGTELDIWIPGRKIGIEFNGVYWHSELWGKEKAKNRHMKKWQQCENLGIRLIQVWEDDWINRREIVLDAIAFSLGIPANRKIGARECRVVPISQKVSSNFLKLNHIQGGSIKSSVRLGLQEKKSGQLMAVLCGRWRNKEELEITRYATLLHNEIVGGFSRLLSHVIRIHHPYRIITFSDRVVSNGNLYAITGFKKDKEIASDYSYVVGGAREHKFGYRRARFKNDPNLLYDETMTESQLAELNGLVRIWDAGKTRWVLDCSKETTRQ